jgi:hypothetical protein
MLPARMEAFVRSAIILAVIMMLGTPILVAAPKVPPPDLLGLTLGMSDLEVRRRLERLGKMSETELEGEGREQIWNLRDRRYQTLSLRLSPKLELQWCTAYARPHRLRYTDVGDTTLARKVGRFIWVWKMAANTGGAAYQITARGADPVYASSVALSPPLLWPRDSVPSVAPADSAR